MMAESSTTETETERCTTIDHNMTSISISESGSVTPAVTATSTGLPGDIAKVKSDTPTQPLSIVFPSRMYGRVKRSFQPSWYQAFPWIEYSVQKDCVFCFPCRFFGVCADKGPTYIGFCDWKHARGKGGTLTCYRSCTKHKDATLSWKQYQSTVINDTLVAFQLEKGRHKIVKDNRKYVKSLMECLL